VFESPKFGAIYKGFLSIEGMNIIPMTRRRNRDAAVGVLRGYISNIYFSDNFSVFQH
jgi:hypothetical protein